MDCPVLFCLFLINVAPYYARRRRQIEKLLELIGDTDLTTAGILRVPRYPEDLPRAEPIKPGHTLLQPELGMLKSAVKFPETKHDALVYGNLDNLGITYGKTKERVLYTGFRKVNNILDLLRALKETNSQRKYIVIYVGAKAISDSKDNEKVSEVENNASEILDDFEFEESYNKQDFRRKRVKYSREQVNSDSSLTNSDSSTSSDYERNPGNPYTVFKDKYRQNWMWNHFMDGDHMNINPYAPQFNSLQPSGAALFFNRKWWYYNQDDYRPFD